MNPAHPSVVVIGGPNGAGKTTVSRAVLAETLGIREYVNADVIAAGLSGFDVEGAAIAAGRIMLARLRELAEARADFAFESTLSSRSFAPWLARLRASGYRIHVIFISLRFPRARCSPGQSSARRSLHSTRHHPPAVFACRTQLLAPVPADRRCMARLR